MIKKLYLALFLFATTVATPAFSPQPTESCNVEQALKACKAALSPYSFQDRKTIAFNYTGKAFMYEYEIQLFDGEIYRFVFNRDYAPGVNFKIYDKPKEAKKRKLVYDTSKEPAEESLLIYHPKTVPYLYIDVDIPPNGGNREKGCATIMIGYELTFID